MINDDESSCGNSSSSCDNSIPHILSPSRKNNVKNKTEKIVQIKTKTKEGSGYTVVSITTSQFSDPV